MTGKQAVGIVGFNPLADGLRGDMPIQPPDEFGRAIGLRRSDVAFREQGLAMKIGQVDLAVVDDGELPHPCPGQRRDCRAADSAGADDGDPRRLEPLLADPADLAQDDMPRVAFELGVAKLAHCPVEPKPPAPRSVSSSSATSVKSACSTGAGTN